MMVVIITKVEVKDGSIDVVLELFKQKNPGLVKEEQDWIKAAFTANRS